MKAIVRVIRSLHGGQIGILFLGLIASVLFCIYSRTAIAKRPLDRLDAYFSQEQAITQVQLAIARGGGSVADINAATSKFPRAVAPTNPMALFPAEVDAIRERDFTAVLGTMLSITLLWIWLGGRKTKPAKG